MFMGFCQSKMDVNKIKKKLEEDRAQLLKVICEGEEIYHPDVIVHLVYQIRGITNLLKILNKQKMRKGYNAEHKTKQELGEIYGKDNIVKVAIGGAFDFFVICMGNVIKLVEVKETKRNKYYSTLQEKEQIERIKKFAELQQIPAEMWIYYKKGRGKKYIKKVEEIYKIIK